jgi:hypothetical protein
MKKTRDRAPGTRIGATMNRTTPAAIVFACRCTQAVVLSMCVACGANPTQPTGTSAPDPASAVPVSHALSVSSFSVTGWYANNQFHYIPTVSLMANGDGGAVSVREIRFERPGGTLPLSGVRYGGCPPPMVCPLPIVPGGGALDLLKDAAPGTTEITSSLALENMTVRVAYSDERGAAGEAALETAVPVIPQASPAATLAIQSFTVTGWQDGGAFHYWPRLTLTETSRLAPASIIKIEFLLLDGGPAGRVPPSRERRVVPAGGNLTLDRGDYDDPWLEIFSDKVNAARVSVTISWVDDAGRAGSVVGETNVGTE